MAAWRVAASMAWYRQLLPDRGMDLDVDLGRVRVTIDDLRALVQMLSSFGHPSGKKWRLGEDVVIKFKTGEIDSPEDLEHLSQEELNEISVQAPRLVIELSPRVAEAHGAGETCAWIYEHWAKPRQTEHRPPTKMHNWGFS